MLAPSTSDQTIYQRPAELLQNLIRLDPCGILQFSTLILTFSIHAPAVLNGI